MINQKIAEEYTNTLVEITGKLVKIDSDKCIHKKFLSILNKHDFIYGSDFRSKIASYFRAMFKNISCNSKVIYPKSDWHNPGITIGTYGIGIKRGAKADVVLSYHDIKELITHHKDKVIKGLNNHRKYKKVEEFIKFIDIISPSLSNQSDCFNISIKGKLNVIYILYEYNYYKFIKVPIDHLEFYTGNTGIISIFFVPKKNDTFSNKISLKELNDDKNPDNVLNQFLFEDQLPSILKEFEKIMIENTKIQKKILKELNTEFGKYIMALKL